MPILSETVLKPEAEPVEPEWRGTFTDTVMTQSSIGTAIKMLAEPSFEDEEGYDPYNDIGDYIAYGPELMGVRSRAEMDYRKWQIDDDLAAKQRLSKSGGKGIAAMLAVGLVDPVYAAIALTPLGMGKNVSTAKKIGEFAIAGGIGETVSEAVIHSKQDIRTLEESAYNISAATLLSGALGGLVSRFTKDEFETISKAMDEEIEEVISSEASSLRTDESVGAARTGESLEEQELVEFGIEKATAKVIPQVRLAIAQSRETRNIVEMMVNDPLIRKKNLRSGGVTQHSVELEIEQWGSKIDDIISRLPNIYYKYRTGEKGNLAKRMKLKMGDLLSKKEGILTYDEFMVEIGKQVRKEVSGEIAEINQAAKLFRDNLYDPALERGIKHGVFPKDIEVKGAAKYLNRIYNKQLIRAKRDDFEQLLTRWMRGKEEERIAKEYEEAIELYTGKGEKPVMGEIDPDDLELTVRQTVDNILGEGSDNVFHGGITPKGSPLKQRVLDISDEELGDFLESDIRFLSRAYYASAIPRIEMQRKFGSYDLKDQIDRIKDDYRALREGKSDKEVKKLYDEEKDVLEAVTALRDRLYNIYGVAQNPDSIPMRISRAWMDINYLTKLGGMTVSASADVHRLVSRWGFASFGKTLTKMFAHPKQFLTGMEQTKKFGGGWELAASSTNSRAMALGDIDDLYRRETKLERGIHSAAQTFGIPTLMAPWNAFWKQFSGIMVSDEILTAGVKLVKGQKVPDRTLVELRSLGISDADLKRIGKKFLEHGEKGDVKLARTDKWNDERLSDTLGNAVRKEVDTIIVTPGAGDRPLIASNQLGKMWLQFNSFAFSATSKMLAAGLQRRDAMQLNGLLFGIALGAGIYKFKMWNKGLEASDDPRVLLTEGIDRMGILGIMSPGLGALEQVTGYGMGSLAGQKMSKYNSRGALGAIFGPSVSSSADFFALTNAFRDGKLSDSEVHAFRKLMPYQNLFWLRKTLDKIEGRQ